MRMSGVSGLWPHQVDAVAMIENYVDSVQLDPDLAVPAALVTMPTGTGKTAVMFDAAKALTARETPNDTLIVVPWRHLVNQLIEDFRTKTAGALQVAPFDAEHIARLLPSSAWRLLGGLSDVGGQGRVWVCTTATLHQLHKVASSGDSQAESARAYEALKRRVSVVFVDEGHYEPADGWASAVRGLCRPTVLLSATPYRNDASAFNVDDSYLFSYPYQAAIADGRLREPIFSDDLAPDPAAFVKGLVGFVDEHAVNARVIVRCANADSVKAVTKLLGKSQRHVIGIHDSFSDKDYPYWHTRRELPKTGKDGKVDRAQYWVHQNKLIEGIDDHRFRVLAVFEPFANDRALIQQIGRVLRKTKKDAEVVETAYIVGTHGTDLEGTWEAYKRHDEQLGPTTQFESDWLDAAIKREPLALGYLNERFRQAASRDSITIGELRFPKTVRIALHDHSRTLDDIFREVENEFGQDGSTRLIIGRNANNVAVFAYVRLRHSPLLARTVFPNTMVAVCAVALIGDYAFLTDSSGWEPAAFARMAPVDPQHLQRLYSRQATITTVSLRNLDTGPSGIRRRTIEASDIGALAANLAEYSELPSMTHGHPAPNTQKRRVGYARRRVTESGTVNYVALYDWFKSLQQQLSRSAAHHARPAVFDRWAKSIKAPARPNARSIVLDVDPGDFEDATGADLDFDALIAMRSGPNRFSFTLNKQSVLITVTWDATQQRFKLSSAALDSCRSRARTNGRSQTLLEYLNRKQAFRIVASHPGSSNRVIYTRDGFATPRLPLVARSGRAVSGRSQVTVLDAMVSVAALQGIRTEKGAARTAHPSHGWAPGSLFNLIDAYGGSGGGNQPANPTDELAEAMKGIQLLVCDDLHTEAADFFAVDHQTRRVIQIHAKAFTNPAPHSASKLHGIIQQAIKNLSYLKPPVVQAPPNVGIWDQNWRHNPVGDAGPRIRRSIPRQVIGHEAWSQIRDAVGNPTFTRHLWIVLGNGLSKGALEAALVAPTDESIQIIYSLQALQASARDVNATLTVFCTP